MSYQFPLIAREPVAEGVAAFTLDTQGHEYTYKAGQHTDYTLLNPPYTDTEGNTRTFSFISSPLNPGTIRFATRMRDTAFKKSLAEIPLGTPIEVSDPMGRFTLHQDANQPALMLVGGIGITPFMSILATALAQETRPAMTLIYSNRSVAATPFQAQLTEWGNSGKNFRLIETLTDEAAPNGQTYEHGPITIDMIKKHAPDWNQSVVYTAGPPAMVKAMVDMLEANGMSEERIKTEDFAGY